MGAPDHIFSPFERRQNETSLERHADVVRTPAHADIIKDSDVEQISDESFFIASSTVMRKVRAQAALLANVNVPVLLVGESGTGKEVVARLIHKLSPRSSCRFLKVNCAASPGDLLEANYLDANAVRYKLEKASLNCVIKE